MAGQPIRDKLFRDVEAYTDPASGEQGWDGVFARIASGETIAAIAKTFGVSRGFFSHQMSRDPERRAKKEAAKKLAAEAMVDDALRIADEANPLTRETLAKDQNRAQLRVAIAGFYDRDQFGLKPQSQVNISIGAIHLDVLRSREVTQALPAPATELPVLPAELLPADTPAIPTEPEEVPNK